MIHHQFPEVYEQLLGRLSEACRGLLGGSSTSQYLRRVLGSQCCQETADLGGRWSLPAFYERDSPRGTQLKLVGGLVKAGHREATLGLGSLYSQSPWGIWGSIFSTKKKPTRNHSRVLHMLQPTCRLKLNPSSEMYEAALPRPWCHSSQACG